MLLSGYKRKTHNLNHIFKMVIMMRMRLRIIIGEEKRGEKRILSFLMCLIGEMEEYFCNFSETFLYGDFAIVRLFVCHI